MSGKRKHIIVPAILAILPIIVVRYAGNGLVEFDAVLEHALSVGGLRLAAGLVLLLPIFPALVFNQTRMALMALLLSIVSPLSGMTASGNFNPAWRGALPALMAFQIVALAYLRERGLFNRFGITRLLVVLLPPALLYFFGRHFYALADGIFHKLPWLVSDTSILASPPISFALVAGAVFLLMRLRGTEYPVLAPAFSIISILVMLGIDGFNPGFVKLDMRVYPQMCFIAAGFIMLWCVFLLSWGRAFQDELTGLPGRRALEEKLVKLSGTYALAMADVDHFKKFNDTYGHDTGDDVLRFVASNLMKVSGGKAYRYGGEEFTIVFSGLTASEAADVLDGVRCEIAAAQLTVRKPGGRSRRGEQVSVTVSFGVAEHNSRYSTAREVLKAADKMLYKAKDNGRNRVCH